MFELVGEWSCETFTNWPSEQRYTVDESDRLVLRNDLQSPDGPVTIVQRFRFNSHAKRWSTYIDGGDFSAKGGEWLERRWNLDGVWRGISKPARLVYTFLGPDAYRRDFQLLEAGRWRSSSGETCYRVGE